jgi:hypothetical protein
MNLLSPLSLPGVRLCANIAYRSISELEDREVPRDDRERDVVDRHRADETFVRAGMAVPVQDEVGPVLGDWAAEAVAP